MKKKNQNRVASFLKRSLCVLPLFLGGMVYAQESEPIPDGMARIIVESESMPSYLGVQMLLDSKAESCGEAYQTYSLPSNITNPRNWRNRELFYDTNFDYRIPSDASVVDSIPTGVVNGSSCTLDIPAGTYDYILVYFNPMGYMYLVSGAGNVGDDVSFEEGRAYKYSLNATANLTYWPPFSLSLLKEAVLPQWGYDLGNKDTVAIKVVNTGMESLTSFKAGYSINGTDSVVEEVQCDLASGDTLVYTFKQNPDFSKATGYLEIEFFVQLDADTRTNDNTFTAELYRPAVRSIPFRETFEHSDSLKHWLVEDLGAGSAGNARVQTSSRNEGALESGGFVSVNSYSNPSAFYLVSDPFRIEKGFQHISFYYSGGSVANPEQIDLLYGTTSEIAAMRKAGGVSSIVGPIRGMPWEPTNYGWQQAVVNIDFEKDSVYYFALGITTQTGSTHQVYIDEFAIDTGRYDLIPDLELLSLVLPNSSCEMGLDSIGVVVRNAGGVAMPGFEMAYSVNGGQWKGFSTSDTVPVGEMRTYYFDSLVDFGPEGVYEVVVGGSCQGQDIFGNDTLRATLYHYEPVGEFPYLADFTNPEGDARKEWYADSAAKWSFNEDGSWAAVRDAGMIHSRCMDLQPGVYRINLRYQAGSYDPSSGYRVYEDFRVGFRLLGEAERSTLMDLANQMTSNNLVDFDTVFEVTEAGTYAFWIDPYDANNFALASFGLEEAYYNDIRLESFVSSTLASVMPADHINATHVFAASTKNRGFNEAKNPKIELYVDKDERTKMGISDSMAFALPSVQAGSLLEVHGMAVMDSVDDYPEDNLKTISVKVSDSVMATETALIGKAITGNYARVPMGNIYTLMKPDTLTSFTYSFLGMGKSATDSLTFRIYKTGRQAGNYMPVDTVLDFRFRMPDDTAMFVQEIPSLALEAGAYFASLVTSSGGLTGFMADSATDGWFYTFAGDRLSIVRDQGNMILRLNFGPERSPYAVADLSVQRLSGPEDSTLMSNAEGLSVMVVNGTAVALEEVPVLWTIDGEERPDTVDIEPLTAVSLTQTADFSALGVHHVQVEVLWPNDPEESNNKLSQEFYCMDKTATASLPEDAVRIYPNPVSSVLNVEASQVMERVALFDLQGRCCFVREGEFNTMQIDVTDLPEGAYFLQVSNHQGSLVKKIVVHGKR